MQERFLWSFDTSYDSYEFRTKEDIKEIFDLVYPFITLDIIDFYNTKKRLYLENIDYIEIQTNGNIIDDNFEVKFIYKDESFETFYIDYNIIKNYLDKHDLINYYPVKILLEKTLSKVNIQGDLIKSLKNIKILTIFDDEILNSQELLDLKLNELLDLGFKRENINILDFKRIEEFYNLDLDLIYVPDINVYEILTKLRKYDFLEELKTYILSGVYYLGVGTGVHLVTKNVEHLKNEYDITLDNYDALGILDYVIYIYDNLVYKNRKDFLERSEYTKKYKVEVISDRESICYLDDNSNIEGIRKRDDKVLVINKGELEIKFSNDKKINFNIFGTIYDINYTLDIKTLLEKKDFLNFEKGKRINLSNYIKENIFLNINGCDRILENSEYSVFVQKYWEGKFLMIFKFTSDFCLGNLEIDFKIGD